MVAPSARAPGPHEIELRSGRHLDLADPDPADITLEDIAAGLSRTARFAGQTERFYSVAEHAVLVSHRLEGCGAETQLIGLHHDDAEAFVGDVPRPLKGLLDGYDEIEATVTAAVWEALRLPVPLGTWQQTAVKRADDWALACEAYHLMPSRGAGWPGADLYDPEEGETVVLRWCLPVPPARAEMLWLHRHEYLTAAVKMDREA